MQSNWLNKQVSLYVTHEDNTGRPATFRDILFTEFANNMAEICRLRKLDIESTDYKALVKPIKAKLQAFTPAALLRSKAKQKVEIIERSGLMQLDFDHKDIQEFNIEELKQAVFSLPFIAFCALSCSGKGFYALALISEPEKLEAYADHCFDKLKDYGIQPDESKGKKPENLRYVSYDANMLFRENPTPLLIKRFKAKSAIKKDNGKTNTDLHFDTGNCLVNKQLKLLNDATKGSRMSTIQKVAYTLGGLGDGAILKVVNKCIEDNSKFEDEKAAFLKCAVDCFEAGTKKLLPTS